MLDNRQVAKAGLLMAAVLALCRFASLGKELYVASIFGAGSAIDAYSLAILVPAIGVSLFVNALRRAFLTQYPSLLEGGSEARVQSVESRVENPDSKSGTLALDTGLSTLDPSPAERLANEYLSSQLLAGALLALLLSIALPPLWPRLLWGQSSEVVAQLQSLTVAAAWLIVPMAAVSAMTAVMNARHHFSSPQWTHVIPPICIVLFVVALGSRHAAKPLVWGLLAGTILQMLVLWGMTRRTGHRLRWQLDMTSDTCRALWMLSIPIMLLDTLNQGNVFIDRSMATMLPTGKISVLYWSSLMKDFVSGTLIASMLWVLLPHFSEQVVRGRTDELRRSCSLVLRYTALLMFPITALLVVCGVPLLERLHLGELDRQAARSLALCLAAYSFGLFAELASPALAQGLLVLRRLRAIVAIGIFGFFLPNIAFNLLLIGPFEEVGLAASTSLVAWLTLGCHYMVLRRTIGMHEERETLCRVAGCLLAAVVSGAVGWGTAEMVRRACNGWDWGAELGVPASVIAVVVVYGFALLAFPGNDDARHVCRLVRDKLFSRTARKSI